MSPSEFPVVIVPRARQAECAAMTWGELLRAEGIEISTGRQSKEGKVMPIVQPGFCSFYEAKPNRPYLFAQDW